MLLLASRDYSQIAAIVCAESGLYLLAARAMAREHLRDKFYDISGCNENMKTVDDQAELKIAVQEYSRGNTCVVDNLVITGSDVNDWDWPEVLHGVLLNNETGEVLHITIDVS